MLRPYSVLCRAWDCSAEALLASSNGEAGFLETWAPLVRGRRLKTPIIDRILRTPSEATNFYRFRFSAEDHLKIKINKNKTICNVKVKINYLMKWKCHTFNGFPTPTKNCMLLSILFHCAIFVTIQYDRANEVNC